MWIFRIGNYCQLIIIVKCVYVLSLCVVTVNCHSLEYLLQKLSEKLDPIFSFVKIGTVSWYLFIHSETLYWQSYTLTSIVETLYNYAYIEELYHILCVIVLGDIFIFIRYCDLVWTDSILISYPRERSRSTGNVFIYKTSYFLFIHLVNIYLHCKQYCS